MGNFTRATFLFHVSSDLIRLDAKVCSESSPELGDDAAVVTRGENNMVLLDTGCRTAGWWDADTDIDMHNIAAYSSILADCVRIAPYILTPVDRFLFSTLSLFSLECVINCN